MKKIISILVLLVSLLISGCTQDLIKKYGVDNEQVVYCSDCGEESKEVSKFCSICGAEAKWVSEKPQIKEINKNETNSKEEESNTNESSNVIQQQYSYKNEYLKKLDEVEDSMSDLDYLYESGTTADLNSAASTVLSRWDDMLNEIYALLKTQLSESEMQELKRKQLNWIDYRDKTAERESSEFEGGSMYSVQYNSTLGRLTKERCYELVNNYMK